MTTQGPSNMQRNNSFSQSQTPNEVENSAALPRPSVFGSGGGSSSALGAYRMQPATIDHLEKSKSG